MDAMIFFSCLAVLLQRHDDITRLFCLWGFVAPCPCSMTIWCVNYQNQHWEKHLSRDKQRMLQNLMVVFQWKARTNLAKIKKKIYTSHINYAVDGGYLLHRVVWNKVLTYKEIIHLYQKYVHALYEKHTIVFEEHVPVPSTKDHKHTKRLMKFVIAHDMSVELKNTFTAVSQKTSAFQWFSKQAKIHRLVSSLVRSRPPHRCKVHRLLYFLL